MVLVNRIGGNRRGDGERPFGSGPVSNLLGERDHDWLRDAHHFAGRWLHRRHAQRRCRGDSSQTRVRLSADGQ